MTPTAPLDCLHADCVDAVRSIRRQANQARRRLGLPEIDYEQEDR